MIKTHNSTKIYVFCPAQHATGGPELLHQLVENLIKLNYDAYLYYYPNNIENPTPDRFKKYKINICNKIEDINENIMIVPETNTGFINEYKNIRKVIWWLSIDNYYVSLSNIKIKIKRILHLYKPFDLKKINKNIFHLVQSQYACDFLKNKGISNIGYLSDYINDIYFEGNVEYSFSNRENLCFYNPKKGIEFTEELIKQNKYENIKFVPIENMTVEQIRDLMRKGKVYIDFGNHPGKDRIPREAAISGCCVITGKKGSAKFYEDVPIDDKFKFDDDLRIIPSVLEQINNCMNNYDKEIEKFENYRTMIREEKTKFAKDIKNIFI